MGEQGWRALPLAWGAALLAVGELAAQAAPAPRPGMPDPWRAAVYSFRAEPRDGEAVLELLQLLPRESPEQGRFVRVRTDRSRDRYDRDEGRFRIEGARLTLYREGSAGETVERARYYGTLICFDDPRGTEPRAFRFVRSADRRTPPPPWPPHQGRPPSRC
ncbi:MAG TPA: hypothetical protein VF192_09880 [Longimicrobiales bacterium]